MVVIADLGILTVDVDAVMPVAPVMEVDVDVDAVMPVATVMEVDVVVVVVVAMKVYRVTMDIMINVVVVDVVMVVDVAIVADVEMVVDVDVDMPVVVVDVLLLLVTDILQWVMDTNLFENEAQSYKKDNIAIA